MAHVVHEFITQWIGARLSFYSFYQQSFIIRIAIIALACGLDKT